LFYRSSWKEPGGRIEDANWTPLGQGVSGGSYSWTVPTINEKRVKLQVRAVGRDASGTEIASHASRWKKVTKPKP
jgi:hypothetical protein